MLKLCNLDLLCSVDCVFDALLLLYDWKLVIAPEKLEGVIDVRSHWIWFHLFYNVLHAFL